MRVPIAIAAVLAACLPVPARGGDGPTLVHLETRDGLTLEADWYPGGEGMPGIVGLHMYPADRTSWRSLAERRPAGFHFLAVDLRGYGGSRMQDGKDLGERVKARDEALFQAMWQDAEAAVKFLRETAECDGNRIGIVGASVGCSLAIDAAVRGGRIAGVTCLSPGTKYFGIPSLDHVKSWPAGTPLLLLAPDAEKDSGAGPLAEALRGREGIEVHTFIGGKDLHGTNLFGKIEGLEDRVARWFELALGGQRLDGSVDAWERGPEAAEGPAPDGIEHGPLRYDPVGFSLWCRTGEKLRPPSEITITVDHGDRKMVLTGEASGDGSLLRANLETTEGGRKTGKPLGVLKGAAMVREGLAEIRVPWSLFGLAAGDAVDLHVDVRFHVGNMLSVGLAGFGPAVPKWW